MNKKQVKSWLLTACCVLASTTFNACSSDDSYELYSAIYPSSVELITPTSVSSILYYDNDVLTLPLIKGETCALSCIVSPDDVTFDDVTWTSSNEEVATVDDSGNVTALSGDGTGYTIINVAPGVAYASSGIGSSIKVVVSNTMVQAEAIEVSASADDVYAGETIQMSFEITPSNTTYKTVQWSSSNTSIATVDSNGVVTGVANESTSASVTITATALDGSGVSASYDIIVKQIVVPTNVTIEQDYSYSANGYCCAIADHTVTLNYTTVPEDCTTSLIEWTSSDESIATVENGVVTLAQTGNFGKFTITATCPETGESSSIDMNMPAGLIRELYHDQDNYGWYNASQSGNGTESSHEWHYGYITITTYIQTTGSKVRGDIKCWELPTYLHAGNYPIFAFRMDDLMDLDDVTARNINCDVVGESQSGTTYKALGNGNNKWTDRLQCSDGSRLFYYDLTSVSCGTGGLLPTNEYVSFTTFQIKVADVATLTEQTPYNLYWVQTFTSYEEMIAYVTETEGLTIE